MQQPGQPAVDPLEAVTPPRERKRDKIANAVRTTPDGTKGIIAAVLCGTLLHAGGLADFLVLIPNSTISGGCLWNVVTFAVVEQGLLQFLLSASSLSVVGRVAEPLWGAAEYVKFLVLTNLFTGLVIWISAYVMFQISGDMDHLLAPRFGFQAGVGALLVAAKQLCGEQELGPIRAKYLASVYVGGCLVIGLLGGTFGWLGLLGTWFGWVYLRFYQANGDRLGDNANSFAFVTFFPENAHDAVAGPANAVFNLALSLKLVTMSEAPTQDNEDTFYTQQASALGTSTAVAERRRNKAQKELEARLQAAGDDEDLGFDDLDEGNDLEAGLTDVVDAIVGALDDEKEESKES